MECLVVETVFVTIAKNTAVFLIDSDIAKAWITTRNSNSFSQAVNNDHCYFNK